MVTSLIDCLLGYQGLFQQANAFLLALEHPGAACPPRSAPHRNSCLLGMWPSLQREREVNKKQGGAGAYKAPPSNTGF